MRSQKHIQPAFSLVELLVVIAIIGVLVAIGFALMGSSRNKGYETVCISNLRQLSHALSLYRADWDGSFPRDSRDLNKPYINDTSIYYCHSDSRPAPTVLPSQELIDKGFLPGMRSPSYLYHSPPLLGQEFTDVYERRGEMTPILLDGWHTSLADVQKGEGRRRIVLRLDGSIHSVTMKIGSSLDL